MKADYIKKIFLIIMVTTALSLPSFAFASTEPEDFRGIKFGQHIDTINHRFYKTYDLMEMENDNYFFEEEVFLNSIYYFFHNEKFACVVLVSCGQDNYDKLYAILVNKYGKHHTFNAKENMKIWDFSKTSIILHNINGIIACTIGLHGKYL